MQRINIHDVKTLVNFVRESAYLAPETIRHIEIVTLEIKNNLLEALQKSAADLFRDVFNYANEVMNSFNMSRRSNNGLPLPPAALVFQLNIPIKKFQGAYTSLSLKFEQLCIKQTDEISADELKKLLEEYNRFVVAASNFKDGLSNSIPKAVIPNIEISFKEGDPSLCSG